jgi:hypothetical protein
MRRRGRCNQNKMELVYQDEEEELFGRLHHNQRNWKGRIWNR